MLSYILVNISILIAYIFDFLLFLTYLIFSKLRISYLFLA